MYPVNYTDLFFWRDTCKSIQSSQILLCCSDCSTITARYRLYFTLNKLLAVRTNINIDWLVFNKLLAVRTNINIDWLVFNKLLAVRTNINIDWLIDWCLTPTLALFQPYRGIKINISYVYIISILRQLGLVLGPSIEVSLLLVEYQFSWF